MQKHIITFKIFDEKHTTYNIYRMIKTNFRGILFYFKKILLILIIH